MIENLLVKLTSGEHLPEALPADPMPLFTAWFDDAMREGRTEMPDAMALATAGADGSPSVRFVLCKKIERGGAIHFYTNYQSRKSTQMGENPRASGAIYWPARARQVRLEGRVERLSDRESDEYFATRPLISQIGAWASQQSRPLESREQFMRDVMEACKRMKIDPGALMHGAAPLRVPRPPHWGGFRLWIERLELWCGSSGRLHDRAVWVRQTAPGDAHAPATWTANRLYP